MFVPVAALAAALAVCGSAAAGSTGGAGPPASGIPAAPVAPVTPVTPVTPATPSTPGVATAVPDAASKQLVGLLATEMRRAGPASGAYVVDLATGRTLYSLRPTTPRIPASVEKLYTTSTALARFGPDNHLLTSVLGVGTPDEKGVWAGNLYVHGGGDPTFGTGSPPGSPASPTGLAAELLAATGISRVEGAVIGDETLFDLRRGDPATGYLPDPDLGGQLSGLAAAHGSLGRPHLASPALYAATQFAKALRASGVPVIGHTATGPTPAGARLLSSVKSPDLATIVGLTDRPSDNFYAETLLKDLGAYYGAGGSTPAGLQVVRDWLARLGIRPHVLDGSGLSYADRTSPEQVVTLLRALDPKTGRLGPVGSALMAALPAAGRTGTLVHRMRRTPAAGNCLAKTGTLTGVSNLAGVCFGRFAFAFLMNRIADAKAHALQDAMTVAIARLGPG